jgi:hypothetical protein
MNKASIRHRRPLHAMVSAWHAAKEWRIESWGRPRFNPSGEIAGRSRKSAGITGQKQAEGIGRHFCTAHEKQVNERVGIAESRAKLLHSLAVELILAEESERRRIADFLHEDL